MNVQNDRISQVSPHRSRTLGLVFTVAAAMGGCIIALGCCCEPGESCQLACVTPTHDFPDDCKAAIDKLIADGLFCVKLDPHGRGDHGVMCLDDGNGGLALFILNNDPKQKLTSGPLGFINVTLSGNRKIKAPYSRHHAEIPDLTPDQEQAVPAGAMLAGAALAASHVKCGMSASGAGMSASGTVGWNIVFNGQAVCVSNYHVLSKNLNPSLKPTPPGVTLGGNDVAKLYSFHALQEAVGKNPAANYWDLALASYNDNGSAANEMLPCNNETYVFPYLTAPPGTIQKNQSFHFRGEGSGCVDKFVLLGTGHGIVKIFSKSYYFVDQLLFSASRAGPKDSGAIIIRDDQLVTGLMMALVKDDSSGQQYSAANPLYRLPWTYNGPALPPNGAGLLPSFSSTATLPECVSGGPLAQ